MRVLLMQTIEGRDGDPTFRKNTHVDVSDEQGQSWIAAEIAIEDPIEDHGVPAAPTGEKFAEPVDHQED